MRISDSSEASGAPPYSPSSTPHSTSRPTTAASTSTFGSTARAAAIASSSRSQSLTLLIPYDEPARAGLTNTGRPSRSRSAGLSDWPARSTAYGPTGMPSAAASFLVNSLSMAAAEAKTLAPTYGMPAISSSPCIVPSSPYAPCSTGNTTSTSPSALAPSAGSRTMSPRAVGSPDRTTASPDPAVISGSRLPSSASAPGSLSVSTQRPSREMPTGTASNSSGSSADSTLPALRQEMPCSGLRPPKTTATRTFRGLVTSGTLPWVSRVRVAARRELRGTDALRTVRDRDGYRRPAGHDGQAPRRRLARRRPGRAARGRRRRAGIRADQRRGHGVGPGQRAGRGARGRPAVPPVPDPRRRHPRPRRDARRPRPDCATGGRGTGRALRRHPLPGRYRPVLDARRRHAHPAGRPARGGVAAPPGGAPAAGTGQRTP